MSKEYGTIKVSAVAAAHPVGRSLKTIFSGRKVVPTPSAAAANAAFADDAQELPLPSLMETLMQKPAPKAVFANTKPSTLTYKVPLWFKTHFKTIPDEIPFADVAAKGNQAIPFSAMTLDEYYVSAKAAYNSGSGGMRQFAYLAQTTLIFREHGCKPVAIFHNVQDQPPGIGLFARTRMVSAQGAWTTKAATNMLRIQGKLEDLQAAQVPKEQIRSKPTKEGMYSADVALDDSIISKLDPTKILMMPLDAIVDDGFEDRMLNIRFDRTKTFGDIWQAALQLQSYGVAVSIRFNQLRVCFGMELTQEMCAGIENEFPGARVFSDLHKSRLPTGIPSDDQAAANAAATDDAPPPSSESIDTPLIFKSVMPKTAKQWERIIAECGTKAMKHVTFGAWAAVTPPKKNVETNLKVVAKSLADKGYDVVVEWQGKPIIG